MLSNPRADRVRAVRALSRRAARSRAGLFLAEGPQSVREAVRHTPRAVVDLYATGAGLARHTEIAGEAHENGVRVTEVTEDVLAAMVETEAPQGVLAVCRPVDLPLAAALEQGSGAHSRRRGAGPLLVVVLAHVRDPGNAGTVIRCADAAGADAVVLTDSSVDIYNPKVVRSTAGSLFHLPVVVGVPFDDALAGLRAAGCRVLAADASGTTTLGDPALDLTAAHAWVMGNEAWGLPEALREACDEVVRVPIHGMAESLNLAMAATVCLYTSATALARA